MIDLLLLAFSNLLKTLPFTTIILWMSKKKKLKNTYCFIFAVAIMNTCFLGEDPLIDMVDASDINSVAGVLKLYFRELREPLFPLHLFDELINCTSKFFLFCFFFQFLMYKLFLQQMFWLCKYVFVYCNYLYIKYIYNFGLRNSGENNGDFLEF